MRRSRSRVCTVVVGLLLLTTTACSITGSHQRRKLDDPAMQFDADLGFVSIRNKTEAAREGAFGGFGAATAGGCACQ